MARLLFVIVLVLSLAATVGAQEQIVIRMYGGYADDGGAGYPLIEHYLREYERLNPHIKIENLGREHDPKSSSRCLSPERPPTSSRPGRTTSTICTPEAF